MFFLVQGQDDFIAANVEKKQKKILTNKWRDERKCITSILIFYPVYTRSHRSKIFLCLLETKVMTNEANKLIYSAELSTICIN